MNREKGRKKAVLEREQQMNNEGSAKKEEAAHANTTAQSSPPCGDGKGGNGELTRSPLPWWAEPDVEPWPEPVNGAELLDGILGEQTRFVVFPRWGGPTCALFSLHSFAWHLRKVTTYLGIESPEKECGKSTLLTVLSEFVNRPAVSANISPSALYRIIEDLRPTLLIDEADTNLRGNSDLRGILNASYAESMGFVWRMYYGPVPGGQEAAEGNHSWAGSGAGWPMRYSSYCAKAIAAIGKLDPVLASRCIVLRMQRKGTDEACERLKRLNATELKRKCARFVADHAAEIAAAEPAIPAGLTNRAADIWEPLFVLADLAGGRWPELARQAALGLTAQAQGRSATGSLLLDILVVFISSKSDRIFSRELVAGLVGCGDRPWAELRRGRRVTEAWLAQQLRPYDIVPRTIRIGDVVGRGYVEEDFKEAFKRYIPKSEVEALKADLAEQTTLETETQGVERTSAEAQGGVQ